MTLSGQIILITGASSGIGRETARRFAAEGARLSLAARREDKLKSLADEIKNNFGGEPLAVRADLARREDVENMIQKTREKFGRIDVLVNNAGVLFMEPFLSMPVETMTKIFDVNFWGIVHAVRAAAPIMAEQGGGHIINIASGVGRRGLPFMAAYTATKFALTGLTESLRLELAPKNIFFTTVFPGGVETEMPRGVDRSRLPENYADHAGMRISAERAARAVVKAARRKPREIYVPWWVRPASWLSVLSPGLADFILSRNYRRPLGS